MSYITHTTYALPMATLLVMALKHESQGLFESHNITPHYTGVGQVKAAFHTHKLIQLHKPTRIINLGTAGSLSYPQSSLVECTSFVQRQPFPSKLPPSKVLTTAASTSLPHVICGTADYIETSTPLTPCDVMDMEAYAIAFVCQQLSIPFTCIKYVSDSSDENVFTDWTSHLGKSSQKLLEQYLQLTK